MVRETAVAGYFARIWYVEEKDSFVLQWRLPDREAGTKDYINPDELDASYKHCVRRLEKLNESLNLRT